MTMMPSNVFYDIKDEEADEKKQADNDRKDNCDDNDTNDNHDDNDKFLFLSHVDQVAGNILQL